MWATPPLPDCQRVEDETMCLRMVAVSVDSVLAILLLGTDFRAFDRTTIW
jgi:hypothetical protein